MIQNICSIGSWAQTAAINVVLAEQIKSSLALAMIHATWFIAILLTLPLGGMLADKWNKLTLIQITKFSSALFALLFIFSQRMGGLYFVCSIALFGLGMLWALEQPASQSVIPQLVKANLLPRALSLSYTTFHVARLIGPLLLGVVTLTYPIEDVFIANAIIMLISVGFMKKIKLNEAKYSKSDEEEGSFFQYLRSETELFPLVLINASNCFFILPSLTVLTARYSQIILDSDSRVVFTVIISVVALGGIVGAIMMPRVVSWRSEKSWKPLLLFPAVPLTLLQLTHQRFYLLAIVFLILSVSLSLSQSCTQFAIQTVISDRYRSRMASLNQWIFAITTALSCIVQGWMFDTFKFNHVINSYSICFFGTMLFVMSKSSSQMEQSNQLKETQHEIP